MIKMILDGINVLQGQYICHRDLKLANILVDKGIPKVNNNIYIKKLDC
jgi:serine/threonine protein kinase